MANGNIILKRALAAAMLLGALAPLMVAASPAPTLPSVLAPPISTVYPTQLSNDEIFYLGGTVNQGGALVVVYLQPEDGSIITREVTADPQGAWFYTHPTFLSRGVYRVWTQMRVGAEISPPSAQMVLEVVPTAFQLGGVRLSYETFYLIVTAALGGLILIILAFTIYHAVHARRKKVRLEREIKEAEEAVRRGFALLHQDIQSEIEVVRRMRASRELSLEERSREEKLLKDLGVVERYVTREVGDIAQAEAA